MGARSRVIQEGITSTIRYWKTMRPVDRSLRRSYGAGLMGRMRVALVWIGIITMTATSAVAGERKDVPDKYKWNLADLYPSEAAWTKAKDDLSKRLPDLAKHRGQL